MDWGFNFAYNVQSNIIEFWRGKSVYWKSLINNNFFSHIFLLICIFIENETSRFPLSLFTSLYIETSPGFWNTIFTRFTCAAPLGELKRLRGELSNAIGWKITWYVSHWEKLAITWYWNNPCVHSRGRNSVTRRTNNRLLPCDSWTESRKYQQREAAEVIVN